MKFFIILFSLFSISSAFSNLSVKEDLRFRWNITNNCGPRPQGPIYPLPDGKGDAHENIPCDVISNASYITGYRCSGQCQTDDSISFEIKCGCHQKIGMILMPKKCAWEFINDKVCPTVSEEELLDWECHHKTSDCKHNKYLDPTSEYNQVTEKQETQVMQETNENHEIDDEEDTSTRDLLDMDMTTLDHATHDDRMDEIIAIFRGIDMNNPTETILLPLILNLLEKTTKSETVINFSPNIEIKMPETASRSIREPPKIVFEMEKVQNLDDLNLKVNLSHRDSGSANLTDSHTGSLSSNSTTGIIEPTRLEAIQRKISLTEARYRLYQWKIEENPDNSKVQSIMDRLWTRLQHLRLDKQQLIEESL